MGNIYINKDLCAKCKGSCCKVSGCMYMPSDFKKMKYLTIKKELSKGNISIDAFPVKNLSFNKDAWTLILFLRARNKDKDVVDLFTSGGPCKMLGENGCFYDEDERPSCGLMVKPTFVNGPCPKTFDDDEFMRSWLKHQSLLELFIKEYTGKEFFDYVYDLLTEKSNLIASKIENNEPLTPSEVTNYESFKQIANSPLYLSSEVKARNGFTI